MYSVNAMPPAQYGMNNNNGLLQPHQISLNSTEHQSQFYQQFLSNSLGSFTNNSQQPTIVIIQPGQFPQQFSNNNNNVATGFDYWSNSRKYIESGYNTAEQIASRCPSQYNSQVPSRIPSPQQFDDPPTNINMYSKEVSVKRGPYNNSTFHNTKLLQNSDLHEGNLMQNMTSLKNHIQERIIAENLNFTLSSDESQNDKKLNNKNSNNAMGNSSSNMSHNMVDIALHSESCEDEINFLDNENSNGSSDYNIKSNRPMQVHIRFPKPRKQDNVYNVRYKTQPCLHYQRKRDCPAGDNCHFAHGPEELRHTTSHSKFRTRFCVNFVRDNWCPYGRDCHFRHD